MANPVAYEKKSADLDTVDLHIEFTVGLAGAVASVTRGREFLAGTAGVVKQAGAGTYRLMLRETWYALLNSNVRVVPVSGYDKTHGNAGDVSAAGDQSKASTPYVEITLRSTDGNAALANAASTDIVKVTLEMQKSKP